MMTDVPATDIRSVLWGYSGRRELMELVRRTRSAAGGIAELVRVGAGDDHNWDSRKQALLGMLDAARLTCVNADYPQTPNLALALATLEIAAVDAGAASLALSGSVPRIPIEEFGTPSQKDRYLDARTYSHGALCITEPLPGAGADAGRLEGGVQVASWEGAEPTLEVDKRGRLTSHMPFADFVVAAVASKDARIRGTCMVVLEPDDDGEFDRGTPDRKLGLNWSPTTSPAFRMRVPAGRIVGGYIIAGECIVPNFGHAEILERTLARGRVPASLMTAAKLLPETDVRARAAGEAAASLGLSTARLLDAIAAEECAPDTAHPRLARRAADAFRSERRLPKDPVLRGALLRAQERVLTAACKLFASELCAAELRELDPARRIDAQLESVYFGPAAPQRRQVAAAMTDEAFLAQMEIWTEEASSLPALQTAAEMWRWTLDYLRQSRDPAGAARLADFRQATAFSMADALCRILAARALAQDAAKLPGGLLARVFRDLSRVQAGGTAAQLAAVCGQLVYGYGAPVPDRAREFAALRRRIENALAGWQRSAGRVAAFLRRS